MIRYAYNQQIAPPAPFVSVTLQNPADNTEVRGVPAQVDTAADRTVLPDSLVQALGLAQMGTILVGSLGGLTHTLPAYAVSIGVHDLPVHSIKVIGSAGEAWVLLGRDVLNTLRVVLDGPQSALEIT